MSRRTDFQSWLSPNFEAYVRLRRATGAEYVTGRRLLRQFDRYLHAHAVGPPLPAEVLLEYLGNCSFQNLRSRNNAVGVIWPALEHARLHGANVAVLPNRPAAAPAWLRLQPPRILSDTQIAMLLPAARALPTRNGPLRPATVATLIGLLLCTGLRIAEALALDVGDIDFEHRVLTVRCGKFGKTRILPVRASTTDALLRYIRDPRRRIDAKPGNPLFVSARRRRLAAPTARSGIRAAGDRTTIPPAKRPRPHDLRHTFTVRTVASWYATGRDVSLLLPALSTYLGHVSVEHTRCYLRANAVLLEHARRLFEKRAPSLWSTP